MSTYNAIRALEEHNARHALINHMAAGIYEISFVSLLLHVHYIDCASNN